MVFIFVCLSFEIFAQIDMNHIGVKGSFSQNCDSIKTIRYDSSTTFLQIIASEIYAHKTHNPVSHLEHTDLEAYYSNVLLIPIDTLKNCIPNHDLTLFAASFFKPLFTHKNGKELPKWNKLTINFEYLFILGENRHKEVIVIVDSAEIYFLRQNEDKCWRLYNWTNYKSD
jgi:hypothetical protein